MRLMTDILSYPWRGSGKYVLICGTILSVIAKVAGLAPGLGLFAQLALFGYFCSIYFEIIQSTATGGAEAPRFPETANIVEDIISPAFRILGALVVSFLPAVVAGFTLSDSPVNSLVVNGLVFLGIFYAPMAILSIAVLGYFGALLPHIVIPAIFRSGGLYLLAVITLCALYFAEGWVRVSLDRLPILASLIVGPLVLSAIGIYILMANGRMLGTVYREKSEELGWI